MRWRSATRLLWLARTSRVAVPTTTSARIGSTPHRHSRIAHCGSPPVPRHAMTDSRWVTLTVNGSARTAEFDVRTTLADALRDTFGCTGVHLGCEQGACGSCTVLLDGQAVRSCLM